MATHDYLGLIYNNPIVPYANNGFQKAKWCFAVTLMDASVKQIQISVFANSAFEATNYAQQLKGYLEANPMEGDQVSIGLRPSIFDPVQHAYKCDMIMMTGQLMVAQSRESIGFGPFSRCAFNCDFWIMKSIEDRTLYAYEFTSGFCTGFKMRSTATLGVVDCFGKR